MQRRLVDGLFRGMWRQKFRRPYQVSFVLLGSNTDLLV